MKSSENQDQSSEVKALLHRLQGPLIRYAVLITGDLERARDVVQDTFLQLCSENRTSLNGHLEQWLYTVCRNRALDVRKKEGRMSPITETTAETISDKPNALVSMQQTETFQSALKIMETMPDTQQEVIRHKFE